MELGNWRVGNWREKTKLVEVILWRTFSRWQWEPLKISESENSLKV